MHPQHTDRGCTEEGEEDDFLSRVQCMGFSSLLESGV